VAVVITLTSLEGLYKSLKTLYCLTGRLHYRSVHNTRIEHIWFDWTTQAGSWWTDFFFLLEEQGGLNIDLPNHLWLLHKLFLNALNAHIEQFMHAWNHHIISIWGEQGCSPIDMFGFDMLIRGIQGNMMWEEDMVRLDEDGRDRERLQEDVLSLEDLQFLGGNIQDTALQASPYYRMKLVLDLHGAIGPRIMDKASTTSCCS